MGTGATIATSLIANKILFLDASDSTLTFAIYERSIDAKE
jgi:hypothetical protein